MVAHLREQLSIAKPEQSCLALEENIVAVITHDRVIDDNLKRKVKTQPLCTCRLFLLT